MGDSVPAAVITAAKKIKLLLLDVDGVLTDGRLYYGNSGEEMKAFNIQDGLGIKLLQQGGVQVGIITGRVSALLQRRADELGIDPVVQGREDKLTALNELLQTMDITMDEIAKHNSEGDLWVIIEGAVYDLTTFLPDHPGGKKAIMLFAGKDATEEFNMLHPPNVLKKYLSPDAKIGTVARR